jgi:Family of unknown function (DUF6328)
MCAVVEARRMVPIEARLKDLLNETRLAMLGAQILLGLQYRAAFSARFTRLPAAFQALDCVALLLILITVNLLLATPAFHQIAERAHATSRILGRASGALQIALLPLSVALAIDVSLGLVLHAGLLCAALVSGVFVIGAWIVWFALPLRGSARRGREALNREQQDMQDKRQSLETRIDQGLTELRVILPGAQALFGFQVSVVLTDSFNNLGTASKAVHLASLVLIVIAIVMLIAPAAYHRIATDGDANEAVLRYIVSMMLPAEGLIALGLVGDAYVTVQMITGSRNLAVSLSLGLLAGFISLLYVLPLLARRSRRKHDYSRIMTSSP